MKDLTSLRMSRVLTSLIYCVLSSSMSLINKYTLTVFPFATTLVLFQYTFSFIAIGFSAAIGFLDMNSIGFDQVKKLVPIALFFHLCIWTGSKVMLHGNVDTFIAFRSLVPGIIAVIDSFRTGIFPRRAESFSLVLVATSGSCFTLVDDKFNQQAYVWGLIFVCTVTIESILIKHTFDSTNVSPWQMSFYLNLFGSIFALFFILSSADGVDFAGIWTHFASQECIFVVLFSCIAGFLTSVANSFARKMLEAASFSMLGVANKFITIGLNVLLWKYHSSLAATFELIFAVAGTVLYSRATSLSESSKVTERIFVLITFAMVIISVIVLYLSQSVLTITTKLSGFEKINISYSSHKCLGQAYSSRSCVFRDISYDFISKEFKYYNPNKRQIVAFEGHFPLHDFPEKFVTLKSMVHRETLYWTIQKVFKHLPPEQSTKCMIHNEVLLWQSMQPINVGHVIMDDMFASFKVTESLGLSEKAKLQVILMQESCTNNVCERLEKLWFPSISYKPVSHFQNFLENYSDCSEIRFKKLYVGGAGSSSMLGNLKYKEKYSRKTDGYPIGNGFIARSFDRFKARVLERNKIHSHSKLKTQILLYNKTRMISNGSKILTDRSIVNLREVSEALRKQLPYYEIKVVDPSTYKSFVDELQDIAKTRVLITPPGGVMFMSLFLPEGSALIGIDACLGTRVEDCGNVEIQTIFSFLNMRILRYTPELRKDDFSLISNIYGIYKKNMRLDIERLMHLLDQALH